ncbi:hypothetical protein [Pseudomonas sp. AF03-9]|uniref:hypothetical protein n=1 Tax=Pseudomonas sp. AF03-9 TaxID=2849867 RepID=UPI001CFAA23C|nr:hypothetical protein [Pseudomonas sp. AF03-9]
MRLNVVWCQRLRGVFRFFWQASRGMAAIVLMCLSAALAVIVFTAWSQMKETGHSETDSSAGNRPGWVCGKISGTVIEVPRHYVLFWPEYEGKSSWEKGFTENKKGCDANFSSLSMPLTWPELRSVSTDEYTKIPYGEFQGVVLTLESASFVDGHLEKMIDALLDEPASALEYLDNYRETSGLYFQERDNEYMPGVINGYYWLRKAGQVPLVFSCQREKTGKARSSCTAYFVIKHTGVLTKAQMSPDKIKEWSAVIDALSTFALSKVKH